MRGLWFVIIIAAAYLIGSISTAIIAGKIIAGDDIRTHGSGNAGATNALRTYGKKAALLVVLGDGMKAVFAILIGMLMAYLSPLTEDQRDLAVYAAGIGVVLGHNFPLYFRFHGGKGVLVSAVAILFADWKIGLAVLAIAILVMAVTRYVSLGSILGGVALLAMALIFRFGDWWYIGFSAVLAALVIVMHHANIGRLLAGTESKLGQKKR